LAGGCARTRDVNVTTIRRFNTTWLDERNAVASGAAILYAARNRRRSDERWSERISR
jgi:hypothetical protein